MAFVHPNSKETKSELDLFFVPATQVSQERGKWVNHEPVSSVGDGGSISFLSPGTEDCVDLSKTILVVRAKVTKTDGSNLDQNTKVGPVNNFLHNLFKQVDVYLQGKQVTRATGTYAYRSYLETVSNDGPAAKQSQLTAALFYKDTSGVVDESDPTKAADAGANTGLKRRYQFSKESGIIDVVEPIFCDVFFSEPLLLSYVDLKVVMTTCRHEICLMSSVANADFKVIL